MPLTPSGKSVGLLSWSHYAALLQVKDKAARDWYEKEAAEQTWSVRTLQRNISSQYYYRMLKTQAPIVGSIPCGSPQYEEENIEEYISLPTAIFGKGDLEHLKEFAI